MHSRTARFALAAAALALAALPLSACKKDGGASGAAGDAMTYLPKDSAMVVSVNLEQARGTDLFKKYQDKFLSQLPPEFNEGKEACGIDPVKDLGSIVIGLGQDFENEKSMVFVLNGNFDKAKVKTCLEGVAKKEGKTLSVKEDGKLTVYGDGTGEDVYAYWPSDKTLVVSPGKETLAALADGKGSVKDNEAIMAQVGKVDGGATVWVAGIVPEALAGQLGAMGAPPKSVYATVKAGSGLDVKVGLGFEKDEQAQQMHMMATMGLTAGKDQAGPFADVIKTVEVKQDGKDLVVTAKLTAEQIESLSSLAGGLGGAF